MHAVRTDPLSVAARGSGRRRHASSTPAARSGQDGNGSGSNLKYHRRQEELVWPRPKGRQRKRDTCSSDGITDETMAKITAAAGWLTQTSNRASMEPPGTPAAIRLLAATGQSVQ